ncbi:hypothetical protein VE02_08283 [Pseudogymnoascus sp. 03VT05]|nr:hypothetical protein VE02_08283 [Pseudogymnoascus sp. 03VT05]
MVSTHVPRLLAENGIADAGEPIPEQEMVIFLKNLLSYSGGPVTFKLIASERSHRIQLGRPGDFADCPVIIGADDDMGNATTKTIVPSESQSPPPSSPRPPIPARRSLSGTSGIVETYGGMEGQHKKKRKRTPYRIRGGISRSRPPSITASIETLAPGASTAGVGKSALPQAQSALIPPTETTESLVRAGPSCQTTQPLEGGMSEILRPEDAVDVMTSVLLTTAKVRIQAGKFGFKSVKLKTTTNIVTIREYTEQTLVELPFKDATEMIAKSGAGNVGIGLQKAWEEAFYWEIIEKHTATLDSMPIAKGPHDGLTPQEKVAAFTFIQHAGIGTETTSEETQRRYRLWWKDLSDIKSAGVVYTLLYRNARFNKYCKTFLRRKKSSRELIDTILSWEAVYSSHIKQIELRAVGYSRVTTRAGWTYRLHLKVLVLDQCTRTSQMPLYHA